MEEVTNDVTTLDQQDTTINYIEALQKIKSNSVSKEDYERVMAENKKLTEALVNGQKAEPTSEEEARPSTDDLRKKLFGGECELSNLEYCQASLELRKNVLEETGQDIFVANNHQVSATQYDYDTAEKVATIMQECIDYAQGDSEAFTNELMRRTKDVVLPRTGR